MTNDPAFSGRYVELSEPECYDLLARTTVGVVAFVDVGGFQQLLPFNYVVLGRGVYLRTGRRSTLATLAQGHDDVAFGAVAHDDEHGLGWSVVIKGSTGVPAVETVDELVALSRPWAWAPGVRDVLVELSARSVTGRQVRARGHRRASDPHEFT